MADVDHVREDLWRRIREYQETGGSVRNQPMALRFGGERGGFGCGAGKHPLCLISVVSVMSPNAMYTSTSMRLGISADDVTNLEAGFEGWGHADLEVGDELYDSAFFMLGQEIAKKLEEEEAVVYTMKEATT